MELHEATERSALLDEFLIVSAGITALALPKEERGMDDMVALHAATKRLGAHRAAFDPPEDITFLALRTLVAVMGREILDDETELAPEERALVYQRGIVTAGIQEQIRSGKADILAMFYDGKHITAKMIDRIAPPKPVPAARPSYWPSAADQPGLAA